MVPNADGTSFNRVGPDNAPAKLGGRFWDGAKKWPCQTPPWGEILAVNVNTGDIAWREPLGSFDELDALGVPKTGTPEPRGGAITTAGGVLFIGAAIDRRFRALDAKTGKELGHQSGRVREGHTDHLSRQERKTVRGNSGSGRRWPGSR